MIVDDTKRLKISSVGEYKYITRLVNVVYNNEIPPIDSIFDVFLPSEMNPGMTPKAWIFNDNFEYNDKHVLSSQATKILVDNTVRHSSCYTKTVCDDKFALNSNGYIDKIMPLLTSSYSSETTYEASVGDRFRLGVRIGGGAVQYHTVILEDDVSADKQR